VVHASLAKEKRRKREERERERRQEKERSEWAQRIGEMKWKVWPAVQASGVEG